MCGGELHLSPSFPTHVNKNWPNLFFYFFFPCQRLRILISPSRLICLFDLVQVWHKANGATAIPMSGISKYCGRDSTENSTADMQKPISLLKYSLVLVDS